MKKKILTEESGMPLTIGGECAEAYAQGYRKGVEDAALKSEKHFFSHSKAEPQTSAVRCVCCNKIADEIRALVEKSR